MLTETYEIQEITAEACETDEEALAIIERCGLSCQKAKNGNRLSFEQLNRMQTTVINWLFPTSSSIESYSAGGIPLRILETYEEHKGEFDHWVVRYAPPAQIVDPILLACNEYEHFATGRIVSSDVFLIGRWGDALESWEALFEKAMTACRKAMCRNLALVKSKIDSDIQMLEAGHEPEQEEVSDYRSIFGDGFRW